MNPWNEIKLDDYENHMSLDSVNQLQTMNAMMKEQFEAYPVETSMVLGVAGGNGLEHVSKDKYKTVYGVDINEEYLCEVDKRYPQLQCVLKCLKIDLINEADKLPEAQLVIANLLIEYIGYPAFQKAVQKIDPEYVSCVFDKLDEVHHQMEDRALEQAMKKIGYSLILNTLKDLPNGKALQRLDFKKEARA